MGYEDPARAVQGADFVVLCTPVGLLPDLLGRIAPALDAGAIVTDVGSTKATVVRSAERLHPGVRFVGSHPMAGSEKRGVEHARADLYRGAVCITTPTDRTDPAALEQTEAFWRRLEMRVRRVSPEDHDRLICDVSHLPHAVAAALVTLQRDDALDLAGKGFMDATRIAGGDGGCGGTSCSTTGRTWPRRSTGCGGRWTSCKPCSDPTGPTTCGRGSTARPTAGGSCRTAAGGGRVGETILRAGGASPCPTRLDGAP
jgi:hypothetical protein